MSIQWTQDYKRQEWPFSRKWAVGTKYIKGLKGLESLFTSSYWAAVKNEGLDTKMGLDVGLGV